MLCGIPFAFFVQLMLLIASSTRGSGKNSYLILASFFIIGVVFAALPFKAAAGLFMPAPQRRQSDGDLSPMTASSRPVSRAHRANTSTTTMNSPPLAPRMLDDHELPRPPIARNERGLGSTWSDA